MPTAAHGEIDIAVPRDRAGSFEPQLVAKGQTRFDGFDDKILSLHARGMTVREIQGHLADSTDVSPDLISRVGFALSGNMRICYTLPLLSQVHQQNCEQSPRATHFRPNV